MQNASNPTHTNAQFLKRLMSMVYDLFILIAIWMLGTLIVLPLADQGAFEPNNPLYTGYLLALHAIFYIWFWTRSGQTLGMKAWKIRVENTQTHSTLTLKQAFLRWIFSVISVLCCGLGFLWMLFDPKKQTLYDRLSGSQVIRL